MKEHTPVIQTLQRATNIPIFISTNNGQIIEAYPDIQLPQLIEHAITLFRKYNCDCSHPLIIYERFFLLGVAQLDSNHFAVVGPSISTKYTEKDLWNELQSGPFKSDIQALLNILTHIPYTSSQNLLNTLLLVIHSFSKQIYPIHNVQFKSEHQTSNKTEKIHYLSKYRPLESKQPHISRICEERFLDTISKGDISILYEYANNPTLDLVDQMSNDAARQKKYLFVVTASLLCRSAIRNGIDSERAHAISDYYCKKMDKLNDLSEIGSLYFRMFEAYANESRESTLAGKHYSLAVEMCCEYISVHLHQKILLPEISEHCGLSPRWLSKLFKSEVGINISEYINQKKLERACQMLRYTPYSISEISYILQYSSQSYFSKQFKAKYHMTPKEYRDNSPI